MASKPSKMIYFKHMCDLGESTSVNNLIDVHGIEYYAHWVLFLELLTYKWDGEQSCEVELNLSVISRKVRIKSAKKLATFLQLLPNFFEITIKIFPTFAQICYPSMWKNKENRGGLKSKKGNFADQKMIYKEVKVKGEVDVDREKQNNTSAKISDINKKPDNNCVLELLRHFKVFWSNWENPNKSIPPAINDTSYEFGLAQELVESGLLSEEGSLDKYFNIVIRSNYLNNKSKTSFNFLLKKETVEKAFNNHYSFDN